MFHDRNIPAKKVTSATTDGDDGPLYAPSKRVFPQSVKGTYRRIKWIVLAVALGIYYLLPFVRWNVRAARSTRAGGPQAATNPQKKKTEISVMSGRLFTGSRFCA